MELPNVQTMEPRENQEHVQTVHGAAIPPVAEPLHAVVIHAVPV